jgi:hypothetical protein
MSFFGKFKGGSVSSIESMRSSSQQRRDIYMKEGGHSVDLRSWFIADSASAATRYRPQARKNRLRRKTRIRYRLHLWKSI